MPLMDNMEGIWILRPILGNSDDKVVTDLNGFGNRDDNASLLHTDFLVMMPLSLATNKRRIQWRRKYNQIQHKLVAIKVMTA